MPSNRTAKKVYYISFTPAGSTDAIKYVFKSNALSGAGIKAADLTALGITALTATPADSSGYVMSPNSPKPPRFTKSDATNGSTTSFCDPTKVSTANAAGWVRSKLGKQRGVIVPGSGKKKVTVYVELPGVNYAWNMNVDLYTAIAADLDDLGIKVPTTGAEKASLVWGSSSPIPARVQKTVVTAGADGDPDTADTYTTFCSQASEDSLTNGWSIIKPRVVFSL